MGTLTVDYLRNTAGTVTVPVSELKPRVVQYYQSEYASGEWNPTNEYNWVPGANVFFTPRRADTRIRYTMRLPTGWYNAAHSISSWYFWAGGNLLWYWSESGTYIENGKTWEFDVPSWGTVQSRIGMQMRAHANDSNELRLYTTNYWDGGGSRQNCRGHLMIEEILN